MPTVRAEKNRELFSALDMAEVWWYSGVENETPIRHPVAARHPAGVVADAWRGAGVYLRLLRSGAGWGRVPLWLRG